MGRGARAGEEDVRRMSFSKTVPQMRARTKTVTRRAVGTWRHLKAGHELVAVEKAQGLKRGERQVVIGRIRVTANTVELLSDFTRIELAREGFPEMRFPQDFVDMFLKMNPGMEDDDQVRRIEFEHIETVREPEQLAFTSPIVVEGLSTTEGVRR